MKCSREESVDAQLMVQSGAKEGYVKFRPSTWNEKFLLRVNRKEDKHGMRRAKKRIKKEQYDMKLIHLTLDLADLCQNDKIFLLRGP